MSLPASSTTSPSLPARAWRWLVMPPYYGIPVLVWAYFIGCFFIHPQSSLRLGNLPDADDYTYLAQTWDWIAGQNWFDTVQHRLDPAALVPIDFSHLAQLRIAAVFALLAPFFGKVNAGLAAAMILPPLQFIIGLFLFRWIADSAINTGYSRLTAFVVMFASYLMFQFSPGHVDHHGLTALLVLTGFGTLGRVPASPPAPVSAKWPALAGFFLSLGLAVGLEILPALIAISIWLGLLAILRGGAAARAGVIFSLSLTLGSILWVGVTIPPDSWLVADQLGFSIVYVIFCASLALCFAGVAVAANARSPLWRLLLGGSLAAVTGYLFLGRFPDLIHGPYGAMDPALANFMFANIPEAIAVIHPGASSTGIFLHLAWPTMALISTVWLIRTAPNNDERWFWFLALLCLVAHMALAAFYQIRFLILTQMFSVLPLTAILAQIFVWVDAKTKGRARTLLKLEALIFIAPLPMLILPALFIHGSFIKDVVLFPVQAPAFKCDMHTLADELTNPETFGNAPHLIMNDMASGPQLLFRTPHIVFSAPYHTNVAGNMDAVHFFMAMDADAAKGIAIQRHANLVVLCKNVAAIYNPSKNSSPNFAAQLVQGTVPDWLTPVHYKGERDFLLFKVSSPLSAQPTP